MKLGVAQVVLWTFGILLAYLASVPFAAALFPGFAHDYVMQAAHLALVYFLGCALFAARRPGRTWSETFAARGTSPWLVVLAAALGIAICIPAYVVANWVEHLVPMSEAQRKAQEELMTPRSVAHTVAFFVFVAGIGPFAEELVFRGALYTGLRPSHGPAYAGWTTGVLFTLGHDPRFWPAILALSGLLALARAVSGSLWPPLFLHAAFNATSLAMSGRPVLENPSLVVVLGCIAASVVAVTLIFLIGRSSASADRARQVDLEPDPGLGEAPS